MSMYPPVFERLKADPVVAGLLGGNPFRVFVPGEAQEGTKQSYLVWQIVGGAPENYMGDLPDTDEYNVQLDAYAATLKDARAVAKAVRDAVEPVAYVTGWLGEGKDPETKLYRVTFQVDWTTYRSDN